MKLCPPVCNERFMAGSFQLRTKFRQKPIDPDGKQNPADLYRKCNGL